MTTKKTPVVIYSWNIKDDCKDPGIHVHLRGYDEEDNLICDFPFTEAEAKDLVREIFFAFKRRSGSDASKVGCGQETKDAKGVSETIQVNGSKQIIIRS